MDLLHEAKKSNKDAFNELVEKYNHIFYKTARVYFNNDKDIYNVFEVSLAQAFKEIVNVKDEQEFLCWTLRILISNCSDYKKKFEKDLTRKLDAAKDLSVNIADKITSSETNLNNDEYQNYRKISIVEEYVTSIEERFRTIAVLYYYANLTTEEISKILKESESSIIKKIDAMRIKIYEMIKNKEVDL